MPASTRWKAQRCTRSPRHSPPGRRFRRCSPTRTAAHRYLFSEANSGDAWVIDVAPMLKDSAFAQVLSSHNAKVPATLTVPLTVSLPGQSVHQGQLSRLAAWGPWVSLGAAVLSGFFGLLTLAAARRRGKALTSLGVSALLVGAAGWVGIEVADATLAARQWDYRRHPPGSRRDDPPRRGGHALLAEPDADRGGGANRVPERRSRSGAAS